MHALAQLCIRRPVFATMLILVARGGGHFLLFHAWAWICSPRSTFPPFRSPLKTLAHHRKRSKPRSQRRWKTRSM